MGVCTRLFFCFLFRLNSFHQGNKSVNGTIDVPLRDSNERMWIQQETPDRVTAIFSVHFNDADDMVIAKVFFAVRRTPIGNVHVTLVLIACVQELKKSMQGAPSCDFSTTPPGELRNAQNLPRGNDIGYVTFGALLLFNQCSPLWCRLGTAGN